MRKGSEGRLAYEMGARMTLALRQLAVAIAVASWVPPARAGAPEPLKAARPGDWVAYRLSGGPGRTSYLRLTITGEQPDALGRPAVWLLVEIFHDPSLRTPAADVSVLVARDAGLTQGGITRVRLYNDLLRPQEVSPDRVQPLLAGLGDPQLRRTGPAAATRRLEKAWVHTVSGPVQASGVEILVGGRAVQRVWTSPQVPVTGLAHLELPRLNQRLELHGFGHASSRRMLPPAPDARRMVAP